MTLEQALTARVANHATFGAILAEDEGWSMRLVSFPAISFQIVVDERPQHMKGFQRVRQSTVQADVWAATKFEAIALRDSLIAFLCPPALVGEVQFQRAQVAAVRALSAPEQSGERQRFRGQVARESIEFIFTHNAN